MKKSDTDKYIDANNKLFVNVARKLGYRTRDEISTVMDNWYIYLVKHQKYYEYREPKYIILSFFYYAKRKRYAIKKELMVDEFNTRCVDAVTVENSIWFEMKELEIPPKLRDLCRLYCEYGELDTKTTSRELKCSKKEIYTNRHRLRELILTHLEQNDLVIDERMKDMWERHFKKVYKPKKTNKGEK